MNPQELRIGNYLKPKYKGLISKNIDFVEVLTISPQNGMDLKSHFIKGHPLKSSYIYGKWESVEPIPLTKEWLLKFGFVKVNHKHLDGTVSKGVFKYYPVVIDVNRLEKEEYPFSFCRIVPAEPWKYNYFTFVKHVHELQNLYFALCGQELTLQNTPSNFQ